MKDIEANKKVRGALFLLFSLFVFPNTSLSQDVRISQFEQQLISNEPMIDFGDFVGAGKDIRIKLDSLRTKYRKTYDNSTYTNSQTSWYQNAFLSNFIFAFDRSFYEYPAGTRDFFDQENKHITGKEIAAYYKINEIIDDGIKEFGGYDIIVLWVSYPRLGIDARNQFDLHKDMPGGLEGLQKVIDQAHERGVKVFIAYNPWDKKTRFKNNTDGDNLAELAHAIGADGIFLDTMASADTSFTNTIEKLNPNIVYSTEGMPAKIELLSQLSGGWQQLTNNHNPGYYTQRVPHPTQFSKLRWIEPRYSLRGDNRDAQNLSPHIKYCFFHGYGFLVWENIFGWYNPMHKSDRMLLKKCVFLLRQFKDAFSDMQWQPFIKTKKEGIFINKWQDRKTGKTVYTIYNYTDEDFHDLLLTIPSTKDSRVFDVWNGHELTSINVNDQQGISCQIPSKSIGCVVVQPKNVEPPSFFHKEFLNHETQQREHPAITDMKSNTTGRWRTKWGSGTIPGMVRIPETIFTMNVCHNVHPWMEGACYSDISTRHSTTHPSRTYYLRDYYIDKTEVTNAMYKAFLDSSRYIPADTTNFLKHWKKPQNADVNPWNWHYPIELANHPVVWVSHDDARAYASWTGKRLPFEEEWQYAAQGPQLNKWPWGNQFDPAKCNGDSDGTMPVDQFPEGASPFGCLDMAGNVWEWMHRVWDDGHTRFTVLRGGSYFKTDGSFWYPASGAQSTQVHEKMLLMYPGLDRSSNIGFRCVMEVE